MSAVTLADLARDGKLLWCWCPCCGRERDLDPASLPMPAGTPVPFAGRRMRCTVCGTRPISTAPEHVPGGVVAYRTIARPQYGE